MSMMGREFQSLGNLKKYELRVVLMLETLWQSFVYNYKINSDNRVSTILILEHNFEHNG